MHYLKIPVGLCELDCKPEFVQCLSGTCGLYFAISCMMVLLPTIPAIGPVITKPRKRKKEKQGE